MTQAMCPTVPTSSPAPPWDTGPLNLPDVYAATVKTTSLQTIKAPPVKESERRDLRFILTILTTQSDAAVPLVLFPSPVFSFFFL